jgi:hypothetical protein
MTPSHSAAAVDRWSRFERPKSLASWYSEGVCDGIGDRLLMFDNAGTPSLELLRFGQTLATANGFEDALRARVDELQGFEHGAFSRVRAVERLDGGDLALVSTFTRGKRVGEMFWSPHTRAGVHPAFAAWLIRELTAAVADLHRQGGGIAHGALSPDKVILTPDGRLVIVEHVLGGALEQLRIPIGRLWQVLGVVAGADLTGAARLDQQTDVIQVAWIALSLLVGRRVSPLDYPRRVDTLLDEFVASSRGRSSPLLVSGLRGWLERALDVGAERFESAMHAHDELGDLRMHDGPHTIAFGGRNAVEQLPFHTPQQLPPRRTVGDDEPSETTAAEATASSNRATTETGTAPTATEFADALVATANDVRDAARVTAPRRRSASPAWMLAAAFGIVAAAEAAWIGRVELAHAAAAPPPAVPVVVETLDPGDTVLVDGKEVGVTPLAVALTSGVKSIQVLTRVATEPPAERVLTTASEEHEPTAAAPLTLPASRDKRGGIRVASPIEVQVLEGERVLGSSIDGPIVTTAGKHELDFLNNAVGYRSRQVVDIKAGQIVPFRISPPDGRVSINAVPWAQVSIDGNAVGETPLANLSVAVGEHEITFRHPQLGEQTQKVIVKSSALSRVSATLTR